MQTFQGTVIRGKARGKKLGFPTANITLDQDIAQGVYISSTLVGGVSYPSLTFVGNAKTFDEHTVQAEIYLLDFSRNIYDKILLVTLLKKIRENKKFESATTLVEQMKKDEEVAKAYFKKK